MCICVCMFHAAKEGEKLAEKMSRKIPERCCRSSQNLVKLMFLFTLAGFSISPAQNEQISTTTHQASDNTKTSHQILHPFISEKRSPVSGATTVSTPPVQLTTPPQQAKEAEPAQISRESATTTTTTSIANNNNNNNNNNWLDSILIRVESLNLNRQRVARWRPDDEELEARLQNNSHDNLNLPVSSSEAPTDSGEDPLETSTLQDGVEIANSLPRSSQMTNATQYSIAADSNLSDEDEPPTQPSQHNNHHHHQQVLVVVDSRNQTTIYNDNQNRQLIESNNVSAVIDLPEESRNQINEAVRLPTTTAAPKQPVSCEQAYTQCALRKVCVPALKSYNEDCHDLINNRTNQCSPKCLKAMIALRSSEEGDDLVKCDCQGDEYCLRSKRRSEACRPQVEQAVDPKTVVSCSTASWICLADQSCSTALEFYYSNCQSLFSQRYCSMRCNNSLSILYHLPKAQKLISCQCDGSEEFPCVRYKTYTERFCLNKPVSTQTDAATTTLDDGNENLDNGNDNDDDHLADNDAQQQAADPAEEDGSNMTDNPEVGSFVPGGFSMANNRDNFHDQDEHDEDVKSAASESGRTVSEDSAAGFNGIQLLEDNWIPLMSGRYFANLRQSQNAQQQQQQQQQQQLRHPKRKYHPKNQQPRDQTQQQQQQQRKSLKNAKQKTNKTNNSQEVRRSRYSRILMLASSSSSACPSAKMANMVHNWLSFIIVVSSSVVVVAHLTNSHTLFTRFLLH